jgi:hypothetical protein
MTQPKKSLTSSLSTQLQELTYTNPEKKWQINSFRMSSWKKTNQTKKMRWIPQKVIKKKAKTIKTSHLFMDFTSTNNKSSQPFSTN